MSNDPATNLAAPGRVLRYHWSLALASSPERLWPLVADTDRFNRLAGIPAVTEGPSTGTDKPLRRPLSLRAMGMTVAWEEAPFQWAEPSWFSVERRYTAGPLRRMLVRADLAPRDGGGSTLDYRLLIEPRSLLGALLARWRIGHAGRDRMLTAFRAFDRAIASAPAPSMGRAPRAPLIDLAPPGAARFAAGGEDRLTAASAALVQSGLDPSLVARLIGLLRNSDDPSLDRLRPYPLADEWSADRRDLLALMLHATRAGLLELRWDVLCPFCRGSKSRSASLSELSGAVHCDACHIDFSASFDRLVELSFRPSPTIRRVDHLAYCIGGPRVTAHVAAQLLLGPGESRSIDVRLTPGRHRLRAREDVPGAAPIGGRLLRATESAPASSVSLDTAADRWPEGELEIPARATVTFDNAASPRERLVMLERLDWADDAATAADVTTMQVFRDLFSSEALRPGEQITVGALAFLFTDLRQSTRLYRELGDAPAFGRVMSHFDVLKDAIASHGGAIVKTIGDAVMGAFLCPGAALRAGIDAQRRLAQPPHELLLKAAVHAGPCIAVTLNERLDYFGSTVNLAARLVDLSDGRAVIVSSVAAADPEAARALGALGPGFRAERFETSLRGFDDEVHSGLAVRAVPQ